jgi:hypothetical protein
MTSRRRWGIRALVALLLFGGLVLGAVIGGATPRLLPMFLFACAVVAILALVRDAEVFGTVDWEYYAEAHATAYALDGGLFANVRMIENHLNARDLDPALQSRLRRLTDGRLARLGLDRSDPDVSARLGPTLTGIIEGPPRRLEVAEIAECVRRIEELTP